MPRRTAFFLLIMLGLAGARAKGQPSGIETDPVLVRLKARIVSAGDSMPIPYVNIVYPRYRTGTSSNAGGYFSIEMLNIDTLQLSAMGFRQTLVTLPRTYSEAVTLIFYMQPVVYALKEVRVTGDKPDVNMDGIPKGRETNIPQELRGDAFNEKPPVLAAIFNPLSYWNYYLSKREKQKRRVRDAMMLEKYWEMHSQNYNKQMVMMLTGLNEPEADTFMVWFNAQNVLPYTSTEYEVRSSVRDYFEMYKKEKKK